MAVFNLKSQQHQNLPSAVSGLLQGYSIEVMPRTAAKVESFRDALPQGTLVYIAHLEGTPFDDMLATAQRLTAEGFDVMPHIPARIIPDHATFENWVQRYAEGAGISRALVLAGGPRTPVGDFDSSMQLLETGVFDRFGFSRLHVAGHPEGNPEIDTDGTHRNVEMAVQWKQAFSERTDAEMALTTQFVFDAKPVVDWCASLSAAGVDLPVHLGVAGPAKLQTLIKFALACGVGPSVSVLTKRAKDLSKLLLPFEPTDLLMDVARHRSQGQLDAVERIHLFPLGGIKAAAGYAAR